MTASYLTTFCCSMVFAIVCAMSRSSSLSFFKNSSRPTGLPRPPVFTGVLAMTDIFLMKTKICNAEYLFNNVDAKWERIFGLQHLSMNNLVCLDFAFWAFKDISPCCKCITCQSCTALRAVGGNGPTHSLVIQDSTLLCFRCQGEIWAWAQKLSCSKFTFWILNNSFNIASIRHHGTPAAYVYTRAIWPHYPLAYHIFSTSFPVWAGAEVLCMGIV